MSIPPKELTSYTIVGTDVVVQVGDSVVIRPARTNTSAYLACVEKIESFYSNININNYEVRVFVRCYCRPEEYNGARRLLYGLKELFLSEVYDYEDARNIVRKLSVHSLKGYTQLESVGPDDYFCRFEYNTSTATFAPNNFEAVYCHCGMPFNPDEPMTHCVQCDEWYHPDCIGKTVDEMKEVSHFVCCSEHPFDEAAEEIPVCLIAFAIERADFNGQKK